MQACSRLRFKYYMCVNFKLVFFMLSIFIKQTRGRKIIVKSNSSTNLELFINKALNIEINSIGIKISTVHTVEMQDGRHKN